jgi:hypothetical protein
MCLGLAECAASIHHRTGHGVRHRQTTCIATNAVVHCGQHGISAASSCCASHTRIGIVSLFETCINSAMQAAAGNAHLTASKCSRMRHQLLQMQTEPSAAEPQQLQCDNGSASSYHVQLQRVPSNSHNCCFISHFELCSALCGITRTCSSSATALSWQDQCAAQ